MTRNRKREERIFIINGVPIAFVGHPQFILITITRFSLYPLGYAIAIVFKFQQIAEIAEIFRAFGKYLW